MLASKIGVVAFALASMALASETEALPPQYRKKYRAQSSPYNPYQSSSVYSSNTFDLVSDPDAKATLEQDGITLKVGETAKIILKQNLSTGYGWEF